MGDGGWGMGGGIGKGPWAGIRMRDVCNAMALYVNTLPTRLLVPGLNDIRQRFYTENMFLKMSQGRILEFL